MIGPTSASDDPPGGAAEEPHELHRRTRLPEAFAFLEREFPRADWPVLKLHAAARSWLDRHAWFRRTQRRLIEGGERWREAGGDPRSYARETFPVLGGFLQHLDGHHRIESDHYFPAMSLQEPRMRAGFELLDRDHDAIHRVLEELAAAAVALDRAAEGGADVVGAAERLAEVIAGSGRPLIRHLDDEEDIVVPMLTLHGDPFELNRP